MTAQLQFRTDATGLRIRKTGGILWLAVLAVSPLYAQDADAPLMPRIHVDIVDATEETDLVPVDGLRVAGQPDAEALGVLAKAGYAAIIDLRGPAEDRGFDEPAAVEALGLDYVSLPIVGREAINYENARKLEMLLQAYEEPVLVHCGSGNRVGALLALSRSLAGAGDDDAIAYGRSAGLTGLESLVRERLEDD